MSQPGTDPDGHLFCYVLTPERWVLGGAINNGGSVLQWLGAALAPDLDEHAEAELLELAAEVPAGSEGLIMLPYLLSERAPHWSALPRGAYVGLRHFHRRGHLDPGRHRGGLSAAGARVGVDHRRRSRGR